MDNFTIFFNLGWRHILEGYDHLLFLTGLVIVTKSWRSLLKVISSFTIAHSTTLVLCSLGVISLDPKITESLIAASIAYVGIENVVAKKHDKRWIVSGSFGLIHGAGFSGHLTDLLKTMLGAGNVWAPLTGFNLGIETGQIIAISIMFPFIWFMRKMGKEDVIIPEISRAIAAVGLVLVVWRIWSFE